MESCRPKILNRKSSTQYFDWNIHIAKVLQCIWWNVTSEESDATLTFCLRNTTTKGLCHFRGADLDRLQGCLTLAAMWFYYSPSSLRPRQISLRLMKRWGPHLFVFYNCGGFNYAFLSKVALITAVQLRCRWNVNGILSTRAVLIGWQRAKCQSTSFPDDSNKPKQKPLKGTNEQMVVGIIVWLW